MSSKQVISDYLKELGSKGGVPGGGSAAGMVGAMSASLARMVADIQQDKKKFKSKEATLQKVIEKTETFRMQFEKLSEKDGRAFEAVFQAFKLPKETKEEEALRNQKVNEALKGAMDPPLEMMKQILEVLDLYEELKQMDIKGSIVNDIAVGVLFAKTTLEASYLNVLVNAEMLKDEEVKESIENQSHTYLMQGLKKAETMYTDAKYYLRYKEWPNNHSSGGDE